MAYEAPKEVNFRSGLVLHGLEQWKDYLGAKRGYVKIDPDLRKIFKDDRAANQALRAWLEVQKLAQRGMKKPA